MKPNFASKASVAPKLEEQIDQAWKDYSLDAPKMVNPIPVYTEGLKRICMVVHLVLPLTKIIFGARYVRSCPTDAWLPTYMMVGGMLQLAFLILLVYKPLRRPALLGIIGLAAIIWMLISSLNIIVEWKPDFFLGGWRYCNKTFFYFAFFVSVSEYIIITLLMLYVCTRFAYSNREVEEPQFV